MRRFTFVNLKSLLFLLLTAVTLLAAGQAIASGSQTPEEAVRRNVANLSAGQREQDVQVLGTRAVPQGVIVLYRLDRRPRRGAALEPMFGYALTTHSWRGWDAGGGAVDSITPAPSQGRFACYAMSVSGDQGGSDTIIYGYTLRADAAAVRVVLADGQQRRDSAGDGVFALDIARGAVPATLYVLDASGRTLQQAKLPHAPAVLPGQGQGYAMSCGL